jgi:hypothetical protein
LGKDRSKAEASGDPQEMQRLQSYPNLRTVHHSALLWNFRKLAQSVLTIIQGAIQFVFFRVGSSTIFIKNALISGFVLMQCALHVEELSLILAMEE